MTDEYIIKEDRWTNKDLSDIDKEVIKNQIVDLIKNKKKYLTQIH